MIYSSYLSHSVWRRIGCEGKKIFWQCCSKGHDTKNKTYYCEGWKKEKLRAYGPQKITAEMLTGWIAAYGIDRAVDNINKLLKNPDNIDARRKMA